MPARASTTTTDTIHLLRRASIITGVPGPDSSGLADIRHQRSQPTTSRNAATDCAHGPHLVNHHAPRQTGSAQAQMAAPAPASRLACTGHNPRGTATHRSSLIFRWRSRAVRSRSPAGAGRRFVPPVNAGDRCTIPAVVRAIRVTGNPGNRHNGHATTPAAARARARRQGPCPGRAGAGRRLIGWPPPTVPPPR